MKILISIFTIALLANSTSAKSQGCAYTTFANTKTERQALYQKGLHSQAKRLIQYIHACRVESNGGFTVNQTQNLHYSNESEINYNRNSHNAYRY